MEDRTKPSDIRLHYRIEVFLALALRDIGENLDYSLVGSISTLIGSFPVFYVSKMFNPQSAQYIVNIFI